MPTHLSFITLKDVSVFQTSGWAIDKLNININEHTKTGIVGETGSGKTTLLKAISGLTQISNGEIWFNQHKIKGPEEQLIPGNSSIAYLSQYADLKNNYHVWELFEFYNYLPQYKIDQFCEICDIQHLMKRWTDELSGGERQRVALTLLLLSEPKLLLLDEPYSNLDKIHKQQIISVIDKLSNELKITCMMASHDIGDLLCWADEILVMKQGRIIQCGDPNSIYNKPLTQYCAGIMGSYQLMGKSEAALLSLSNLDFPSNKKLLIRSSYLGIDRSDISPGAFPIVSIEFKGNNHLFCCE